jgi:hypothetical protein
MEPAMLRTARRCRKLAPSVVALAFAVVIGGVSTAPARAQGFDENRGREMHRDHDNREHYRQHDHHRDHHRDHNEYESRSYGRPAYVYSPPPVYYAPPPGPPIIDFVFPLRFR